MDTIDKQIRKIDSSVKQGILKDKDLNNLLQPFFADKNEIENFIKKCLTKLKTRRMLLRVQWYTEIADDLEKIRQNRPALRLVFLIALAESIAKTRLGKKNISSLDAVKNFFKYILQDDKQKIINNFRRALLEMITPRLRFSSIIKILCEVRNKAVHGEDFWSFFLLEQKEKREYSHYNHYSLLVSGSLGKIGRKKRVSLSIKLTYEELRDIIIRTAIENIKPLF